MLKVLIHEINTASKWFLRSLKKGDWLWLMIAVIIASSTVTVVKQLGETVQQSMLRKASESLGADYVIQSSRPIDQKWQHQAEELGLKTSRSTSIVTMALSYDTSEEAFFQLVQLKGISDLQPLRGEWTAGDDLPFQKLTSNSVWVDPSLLSLLPLQPDSELTLGNHSFKLAGSLKSATLTNPMANIAPQVWINLEQLESIGLLGPGSRATYSLSVAGDKTAISQFSKLIEQESNPAWQLLSAEAPSEDLGNSLETAWLFLDLSALSAVLVAGMSILIASRFYLARWKQSIALMRAFGANNAKMYRLFAFQMTWIAAISSLFGVFLGYLFGLALTPLLDDYFSPLVVADPISAMTVGFFSGLLVLWTFAWQAFQSAVSTAPIHVLKSVTNQNHNLHWLISFFFLIVLISLMLDIHMLHWIIFGIVITSLVLFIVASLLIRLLAVVQKHARGWFKIALSHISKEPGLVQIQLVSVGMVLFVLMLMTFVRQDLMVNWQASLPDNTPNAFAMNIQPDQKAQADQIFAAVSNKVDAPMVRGRLVAVNQQTIDIDSQASERAKRLLRREANIAVQESPPAYNKIVESIDESQLEFPKVSVEKGIADLFKLNIGDKLDFNIAGQVYRYQVSSIREVRWQSFQLNFFFIIEPVEDRLLPITYLSNFLLPSLQDQPTSEAPISVNEQRDIASTLTKQLAEKTPGILLIDVRKIMLQVQEIMEQATWAVSALYGFTLLASMVVLFTATLASQQSRVQNWLLLRTIGAQNKEIYKIGLTEFFFLGGLAGLFAASLAQISSLLISQYMLNIPPQLDFALWFYSIIIGGGLFFAIGLITQWSFLQKSAQQLKHYLAQS